jgi:hypothetical protein
MRTTITIDDELFRQAVEVADRGMDEAEIVREAMRAVLVDTSICVGHFRRASPHAEIVARERSRPMSSAYSAGTGVRYAPSPRWRTRDDLKMLRQAKVATTEELLSLQ